MALVDEQPATSEVDIIDAEISGARIIDAKIVDGRIIGGRIVDGWIDTKDRRRKASRARRFIADQHRAEIVTFLAAGLAFLLIQLI